METGLQKKENLPPALLIQQAIMNKLPIEVIETLVKLQREYEEIQARKAFKDSFAKFQCEKPELKKMDYADFQTSKGHVKYNYNAISNIQKAVDPILGKYGLSYRWEQEQSGNKIKITCIVSHLDGHTEKTWIEAEPDNTGVKNNIQAIGSTITYLKRYTLEGALGLASGNDNDGNVQSKKGNKKDDNTELLIKAMKELDILEKQKLPPDKLREKLQKIWKDYRQFQNHEAFSLMVGNLNKKCLKEQKAKTEMP